MQSPALKPLGEAELLSLLQSLDNQLCHRTVIKARQKEQLECLGEVLQQYVGPTHMTGVST